MSFCLIKCIVGALPSLFLFSAYISSPEVIKFYHVIEEAETRETGKQQFMQSLLAAQDFLTMGKQCKMQGNWKNKHKAIFQ